MKLYYEHAGITIYHGDCREILPQLPKVALVLTDIPYCISQKSNGLRELDYGAWDHDFNVGEFLPALLDHVTGSIAIWCENRQVSGILDAFLSADMIVRTLSWCKTNPTVINGDKVFLQGVELCAFGKHRGAPFYAVCHKGWWIDNPDLDRWHPCQKPLSLIASQINATTRDSNIVLDPFMGSGTTLVAAKQLGRQAIGIEIEEKYCEIAAKRLAQEVFDFTGKKET